MSAADDVRVSEARRRLASLPPDTELPGATHIQLTTWLVRVRGAGTLLDAYVRDRDREQAEDTRRLGQIRALLARFDWEHDDRQYALEAIERIVGDAPEAPGDDEPGEDDTFTCSTCGALIGMFIGRQGWQHYRGDGTAASPVEIYDAGHEATFAAGGAS